MSGQYAELVEKRIPAAIERITSGLAPMRIPVDNTDPDIVLAEAASALTTLTQDAKRYQWLKANHLQTGHDSWIRTGDDLEEAIDAAMEGKADE